MTRISSVNDPAYQIEVLKGRIEALERRNPLNSASIDPDVPGISAGSNVFNSSGFQFMWGGELRSVGSVAAGLNSKADGIQSQVNDKADQSWVQSQINSLQSQIDGAAGSGDVAALAARVSQLEANQVEIVRAVVKIISRMALDPGQSRPTPPVIN